jgi:hypothetical protein
MKAEVELTNIIKRAIKHLLTKANHHTNSVVLLSEDIRMQDILRKHVYKYMWENNIKMFGELKSERIVIEFVGTIVFKIKTQDTDGLKREDIIQVTWGDIDELMGVERAKEAEEFKKAYLATWTGEEVHVKLSTTDETGSYVDKFLKHGVIKQWT